MDACEPKPVLLPNVSNLLDIAGSGGHTCAVKADGTVACWGAGHLGQLGAQALGPCPKMDGKTCSMMPVVAAGVSLGVELGLGGNHSCVRRSDGTVWCWGLGDVGQLGASNGCQAPGPSPGPVVNQSMVASLGASHDRFVCARQNDGTLYCWGNNDAGQLGAASTCTTYSQKPLLVAGQSSIVQVAAGVEHTCALRNDGSAQCWGLNEYGQLGAPSSDPCPQLASQTCSLKPVTLGITSIAQLALADLTTCALKNDGTVVCVGASNFSQLGSPAPDKCGVGNTPCSLKPLAVAGLSNVVELVAGGAHFCARRKDGAVLCWGFNAHGQLGDGTTTDHVSPTLVPL